MSKPPSKLLDNPPAKHVSRIAAIPLPSWHPDSPVALRTAKMPRAEDFDLLYYCDEYEEDLIKDANTLKLSSIPFHLLGTWKRVKLALDIPTGIGLSGALRYGLTVIDTLDSVRDYAIAVRRILSADLPIKAQAMLTRAIGDNNKDNFDFELPADSSGTTKLSWWCGQKIRGALSVKANELGIKNYTLGGLALMIALKDQEGSTRDYAELVDNTIDEFLFEVRGKLSRLTWLYEEYTQDETSK